MLVVSDIHFGSGWDPVVVSEAVVNAAVRDKHRAVIVAGDLTQDARAQEYGAARAFLAEALGAGLTVICTPGNHDFGRWPGEKLKNERARDLYAESVLGPLVRQQCVVAAREYDAVTTIGQDVFVTLRSTHAHITAPNRITGKQVLWASSVLSGRSLEGMRVHLVTHRSLWSDPEDRHPDMHRRRRLEEKLLAPFRFATFIHGHNHRFVFDQKMTPKLEMRIQRLAAPTLSPRNRDAPTGFVEWDPADPQATRFVPWIPSRS